MRHISENKIVSISANSEAPNFPATRMLDEHPKRPWKAATGVSVATITAGVVGGCSDIMFAGTNAASASVTVTDPNAIEWESGLDWETGVDWAELPAALTATVTQRSASRSLWIQLSDTVEIPCEVEVVLSGPGGEAVHAGVMYAGIAATYGGRNPQYGLQQSKTDYSIFDENSNGSFYYKKRDIVRSFECQGLFTRAEALNLQESFGSLGKNPSAWRLTDETGNDWVVFGRFADSPKVNHAYFHHSIASFSIIEVL